MYWPKEFNQEDKINLYIDIRVSISRDRGRLIGTNTSLNDKMQLLLTSAEPAVGTQQHLLLCMGNDVCSLLMK